MNQKTFNCIRKNKDGKFMKHREDAYGDEGVLEIEVPK